MIDRTDNGPELDAIARRYRRFATVEADGISPLYAALARAVADDRSVLRFLADLPPAKQQPNLLFAAFRRVAGTPDGPVDFLAELERRSSEVRQVLLARANQLNEPGRCGVLLPLLATIPGPLSLIEVGASAGLCLIPDRYRYRWRRDDGTEHRLGDGDPEIIVSIDGPVPLPDRLPDIVWRAGLDLAPVDPTDPAERDWLLTLVWPEHRQRAERLRSALDRLATDPPRIAAGDLRTGLADLVAEAPPDTTVVVQHSAVLAYLPSPDDVARFATTVDRLGVRWIANEAPGLFPDRTAPFIDRIGRDFALLLDGVPVAAAGPHGQSLRWFH